MHLVRPFTWGNALILNEICRFSLTRRELPFMGDTAGAMNGAQTPMGGMLGAMMSAYNGDLRYAKYDLTLVWCKWPKV